MEIRKISIGADYKSGAMHYIVGQDVLGGLILYILFNEPMNLLKFGFKKTKRYICGKNS